MSTHPTVCTPEEFARLQRLFTELKADYDALQVMHEKLQDTVRALQQNLGARDGPGEECVRDILTPPAAP